MSSCSTPCGIQVLDFDFTRPIAHKHVGTSIREFTAVAGGVPDAVVMWWDLHLDDETVYSTRVDAENWQVGVRMLREHSYLCPQDHWLQAVYPLSGNARIDIGATCALTSYHSDTAVWFEMAAVGDSDPAFASKRSKADADVDDDTRAGAAPCICGWHALCNTDRLLMLNDADRSAKYHRVIEHIARRNPAAAHGHWLDIGDGSMCALTAAAAHPHCRVVTIEGKLVSRLMAEQLVRANERVVGSRVLVLPSLLDDDDTRADTRFDVLLAEPFFFQTQSLTLWQALSFWYQRTALAPRLSDRVTVMPQACVVCAVPVQFQHLHTSYGAAGLVEGFDHSILDEAQQSRASNATMLTYPLWMYPFTPLAQPAAVSGLDFTVPVHGIDETTMISITTAGMCHAVVVWAEYRLDEHEVESTGLLPDGRASTHYKQNVRFLPDPVAVLPGDTLEVHTRMVVEAADFAFSFRFV